MVGFAKNVQSLCILFVFSEMRLRVYFLTIAKDVVLVHESTRHVFS